MDNVFNNLVPPNMDEVCVATTTLSTTITTCSDPWNYYKGYGVDLLATGIFITLMIMIFVKRR